MGWEVGDLALCVKLGPWIGNYNGRISPEQDSAPKPGRVYRVEGVCHEGGIIALYLEGVQRATVLGKRIRYNSSRFVKVTPPAATQDDHTVIASYLGEPVTAEPS